MAASEEQTGHIAVIGSGLIGRSWAMLWASGGHAVRLYDVAPGAVAAAGADIARQLRALEAAGALRGALAAARQEALISEAGSLEDAVRGAAVVQENVPEVLEVKRETWAAVDAALGADGGGTLLLSSTSALPASTFTAGLTHRAQCLVAHPLNPPYYVPLVELVPAPWTSPDAVARARRLLEALGQKPALLKKEVVGFMAPRLQNAMIMEGIRLVNDGVISAGDLDKVMTAGLGRRYAFMGVMETIHLNAQGVLSYCDRYADMIADISSRSGPPVPMDKNSPAIQEVFRQLCDVTPMARLDARRDELRRGLLALQALKRDMDAAAAAEGGAL